MSIHLQSQVDTFKIAVKKAIFFAEFNVYNM